MLIGKKDNFQYEILETDKLIFFTLKSMGLKSNSTYGLIKEMEKRKSMKKEYIKALKNIHLIRNSIVHELDFYLPNEIAIKAYRDVRPFFGKVIL